MSIIAVLSSCFAAHFVASECASTCNTTEKCPSALRTLQPVPLASPALHTAVPKACSTCDSADSVAVCLPHALRGCCRAGAQVSGSLPTQTPESRDRTSQKCQRASQHAPAGAWPWRGLHRPLTQPPRPAVSTGIRTRRLWDRSMASHSWGGSVKCKHQHHAAKLLLPHHHLIGINICVDDSLSIPRVSAGCAQCWANHPLGLWCICDGVCWPASNTAYDARRGLRMFACSFKQRRGSCCKHVNPLTLLCHRWLIPTSGRCCWGERAWRSE